jgi:hypothetical protein
MKPSSTKTACPLYHSPLTPSSHSPQLAIPSPLAFRKLQHIAAKPSDLSERPVNAESEAEFDSYGDSPCSATGKHMSMVHQLMMKQQQQQQNELDKVEEISPESGGTRSRTHSEDRVAIDGHSTDPAVHHSLVANTKSLTMIANAGFVVKTKRLEAHAIPGSLLPHSDRSRGEDEGWTKVFINVLHHRSVDELLASQTVLLRQSEKPLVIFGPASHVTDKEGEGCALYSVAVGSEYFTLAALSGEKGEARITDAVCVKKVNSGCHY